MDELSDLILTLKKNLCLDKNLLRKENYVDACHYLSIFFIFVKKLY